MIQPAFGDDGSVKLSNVSIRVSSAYVLAVSVVATIALLSPMEGQVAGWLLTLAWLLTLGPGTLLLSLLYFLVLPALDLTGLPMEGPVGLAIVVFGYGLAAVVNVVLVLGLMALCRELRDGRGRARARAAGLST